MSLTAFVIVRLKMASLNWPGIDSFASFVDDAEDIASFLVYRAVDQILLEFFSTSVHS